MKTRIALLGCLVLVWNTAIAKVECAKAPYGESVAQYGRDEFQLGVMSKTHNDRHASGQEAMMKKIDREMRAACLAKFYGKNVSRYTKLGMPPHALASKSVGSIAAVAMNWSTSHRRSSGAVVPPSRTGSVSPTVKPAIASNGAHNTPSGAHRHYMKVTSNFPACPRKVDLKRLLAVALIDKTGWRAAEAASKRHGCVELHAGEHVYRLKTDLWDGVIEVRPQGRTRTYWTDAMVVK